jgi:hypothetical protein
MNSEEMGGRVIAVSATRTKEPILRAEVPLDELERALKQGISVFRRSEDIPPQSSLGCQQAGNTPEAQPAQCSEPDADSRSLE